MPENIRVSAKRGLAMKSGAESGIMRCYLMPFGFSARCVVYHSSSLSSTLYAARHCTH